MANHTIAAFQAVEVAPASTSGGGVEGFKIFEYQLKGDAGITVSAADTVEMWELPATAGLIVNAASVETVVSGTAGAATLDVQIAPGGSYADVTALTGFALNGAVGTQLVKFATGANTATHTAATTMRVQINTAGLGKGEWIVRVYGLIAQ
jgi:hypothetical protein